MNKYFPMNCVSKIELRVFLLSSLLFFTHLLSAQEYQQAWEALNQGSLQQAKSLLDKAVNGGKTTVDIAFTQLLISELVGQEEESYKYLSPLVKQGLDLNPYYYSRWWDAGVAGYPGLKSKDQKSFLEYLLKDPKTHPEIKASIRYHLGHHYLLQNDQDETKKQWAQLANVQYWQFTGPFDNLSESGFDKAYPPIKQAEPDARFKALNNADIQWFTPAEKDHDPWIMSGFYIQAQSSIVYAQSFVNSPKEQKVILGLGLTGNAKVWLNDQALIAEREMLSTDFDFIRVPCTLKQGVNRVLVQLGFVEEDNPNFIVRFIDEQGQLIQGLSSSATYAPYPKETAAEMPLVLPFFAEQFFRDKIAAEPQHLLHYILLSACYRRANKNQAALEVIERALKIAPLNPLLLMERMQCYIKLGYSTELASEFEALKERDPDGLLSLTVQYEQAKNNEHYEEAEKLLNKIVEDYGEDASTLLKRIDLAAKQEKIEELLRRINQAAQAYPEEEDFAMMQYRIATQVEKSNSSGRYVLEQFLKRNDHPVVIGVLAKHQIDYGSPSIGVDLYEKLMKISPQSPSVRVPLYEYYVGKKDYKKAKLYIEQILAQAPYNGYYWNLAGQLAELSGNQAEALKNFHKALHYSPNDHELRKRIRQLENKVDLNTVFPSMDHYALIKKTNPKGKEGQHDWYYIFDEQNTIIYPERNSEMLYSFAAKILNEKGLDYWKESSIGYNPYQQKLIIEKAEAIKPNGSKIVAEQNDNEMVFPNLAIGDVVYVSYRKVSYAYGRMAREYWDHFSLNSWTPVDLSRCSFLVHESIPLKFKAHHFNATPQTQKLPEGYTLYTWESNAEPAIKDERISPPFMDISKSVFASTIADWSEIATWYSDVSAAQAKPEYEVQKLLKELFPNTQGMSELDKAKKIYTWVVKNIRYSSVPFRQSAYVPQRAAKVIQTRLGDCKDLSTLYATLAREVGLNANLVLVSTRSNGRNAMLLPSVEFNHCIVKVLADAQTWYLELTDSNLPFGSLPNEDLQALALEIPHGGSSLNNKELFVLNPANRVLEQRRNEVQININKRDFEVSVKSINAGTIASGLKSSYKDLSPDKRNESMQSSIASKFSNGVNLKSLNFGNFDTAADTFQYRLNFVIKNEVVQIGELNTFKIPFYSRFVEADAFPEEERQNPVSYWDYEDTDVYAETLAIQIPTGKQFTEIPKDITLKFKEMVYSLKYEQKEPGKLKVAREIKVVRDDIPVQDYPAWRAFVEAILEAEAKYVAYK
jgi:tetratricopeptide (TPR) repeat protein